MRLAYVAPLPPVRSGVADYSAALLPHLRGRFEHITAVVDGYAPRLPGGVVDSVVDASNGVEWWGGARALPLYHLGNHAEYHRFVYRALQRIPGITVLHDGNLLPFLHEITLASGRRTRFVREAGFERGWRGTSEAWRSLREAAPLSLDAYPMLARVARASIGVIVHSQHLRDRLLAAWPQAKVCVVPMLDVMPPGLRIESPRAVRTQLGLPPDSPLIGAFGFIAPSKRLDLALRAFALLREAFPGLGFVCVGDVARGYDFSALQDELNLASAVRVTGFVPAERFASIMGAVDVAVNLRWPTWGEMSATLIRLLGSGTPTVVTDAGAFSELPDDVVVKVPAWSDADAVADVLAGLLSHASRRASLAEAARAYVAQHCSAREVAEQYAAFIQAVVVG